MRVSKLVEILLKSLHVWYDSLLPVLCVTEETSNKVAAKIQHGYYYQHHRQFLGPSLSEMLITLCLLSHLNLCCNNRSMIISYSC